MKRSVDLSRFAACTIKKPALSDLMKIPDFKSCVDSYSGKIDDEWVFQTATKIEKRLEPRGHYAQYLHDKYGENADLWRSWKYRLCHKAVKYMRRELLQNEEQK